MTLESILLSGEFQSDRLGASYERAFRALGHTVHRFDIGEHRKALAWPARNRVLHRLAIHNLTARRAWSNQFNHDLINAAKKYDAPWVFIHNGEWLMPETVRALREQGRRVAIFHADNPFPPHYNNRPETLATAREADLYLIWSERLVEHLQRNGFQARFLAFGWDPEICPFQGDLPQGTRAKVVFIGNWDAEREALLDHVAAHVPLEIYGSDYWRTRTRKSSRSRACWQGRTLNLSEAAKVIRESAICLNVLRTQHYTDGVADAVIMRHFEVPGAGGFLLSTRSGVATRLFPEGHTAEYYLGADECVDKCRRYLESPVLAQSIAAQAHEEVSTHHTYIHRATELSSMLRSLRRHVA